LGLAFNGSTYSIGDLSIGALEIKVYNQEQFDSFLEQAKGESEREQAKKVEQERIHKLQSERSSELLKLNYTCDQYLGSMEDIQYLTIYNAAKSTFEEEQRLKKEEEERLNKVRQDQETERLKIEADRKAQEEKEVFLKEMEAKIEADKINLQAEKAQLELARVKSRTNQLLRIGFDQNTSGSMVYEELEVTIVDIKICNDDEWMLLISNFTSVITERKRIAEEKASKRSRRDC
jgi:hypothetical protein